MLEKFHEWQMGTTSILLITFVLIYTYGPADRIQLAHDGALVCMAFLFGKYTNGFTRKKPSRWDDNPIAKIGGIGVNGQDNAGTSVVLDYQSVETADTGTTTRRGARYSNIRRE